jgi:hypothetical protein
VTDGILANSVDVAMTDGLASPAIDGFTVEHEIAFTVLHVGAVSWTWSLVHEFASSRSKIHTNPAGDTAWVTPDVAEKMAVSCLVTDSDGSQNQFQLLCTVDEAVSSTPVYGHRLVKRHPDTVTAPAEGAGVVLFQNSITDEPAYKTYDDETHSLTGAAGPTGLSFRHGSSAPSGGSNGDSYVRTGTDPTLAGRVYERTDGSYVEDPTAQLALRQHAPARLPYAVSSTGVRLKSAAELGTTQVHVKEVHEGCGGGARTLTQETVTDNGGTYLKANATTSGGTGDGWAIKFHGPMVDRWFGVSDEVNCAAEIQAFFDVLCAAGTPDHGLITCKVWTDEILEIICHGTNWKSATLDFAPGAAIYWNGADGVPWVIDMRGLFRWRFNNLTIYAGRASTSGNRARSCYRLASNQEDVSGEATGHGTSNCEFWCQRNYWFGGTSAIDEGDGFIIGTTPVEGRSLQVDWTRWWFPVCEGAQDGAGNMTARSGCRFEAGFNTGNFEFYGTQFAFCTHGIDGSLSSGGKFAVTGAGGGANTPRTWLPAEIPVMVKCGGSWGTLINYTVQQVSPAKMATSDLGLTCIRCEYQGTPPADALDPLDLHVVGFVVEAPILVLDSNIFTNANYTDEAPIAAVNCTANIYTTAVQGVGSVTSRGNYYQMLGVDRYAPIYCQHNTACGPESWWALHYGAVQVVSQGDTSSVFVGEGESRVLIQSQLLPFDGATAETCIRKSISYAGNPTLAAGDSDYAVADFGVGYNAIPTFPLRLGDDVGVISTDPAIRFLRGARLSGGLDDPYGAIRAEIHNATAAPIAVPAATLIAEVKPKHIGPSFLVAVTNEAPFWEAVKDTALVYFRPDWGATTVNTPPQATAMADMVRQHVVTCPNPPYYVLDAWGAAYLDCTSVAHDIEIAAGTGWGSATAYMIGMQIAFTDTIVNPTLLFQCAGPTGPDQFIRLWYTDQVRYDYGESFGNIVSTGVTLSEDVWHSVWLSCDPADGGEAILYVDGSPVFTGAYTGTALTGLAKMLEGYGTKCRIRQALVVGGIDPTLPGLDWAFLQTKMHMGS